MSDLKLATQDAVFAALQPIAGMTIDGKPAQVMQHVPENTQPPLIVIGDIVEDNLGAKDSPLDRHTIEIVTEYRGGARKWLYQMMGEVRSRLEGIALAPATGVALSSPTYEGSEDGPLDDGVTYQGRQRFVLFAQPSD